MFTRAGKSRQQITIHDITRRISILHQQLLSTHPASHGSIIPWRISRPQRFANDTNRQQIGCQERVSIGNRRAAEMSICAAAAPACCRSLRTPSVYV